MSSVRKNEQSQHRFTILDAALDLYDHTTTVTANSKIFKSQDMVERINNEASMIYHCCRSANEDLDTRKKDEALMRIRLEEEALEHCKWLKTDIKLAQRRFHFRAKKAIAWTKMVNHVIELIKAWIISEKRNCKQNHGL